MAAAAQRPKLLAVVGPTASGKSELAMRLAKEFDGEIICADSRTIYRGMDIGTAKPTAAEQKQVPHWGLDLVEPGKTYSAAKFKKYAKSTILDIQNRGKLPILVGGTGLYIDALLYDYPFSQPGSERDPLNPRHLKKTTNLKDKRLPPGVLLVGLMPPDEVIKKRIASRAQAMFGQGIVPETKELIDNYGQAAVASTAGIVYKIIIRVISGEITEQEAIELFKTADWQYARRQKTWFKRNEHIKWFNTPNHAYIVVKKQLLNT